MTHRFHPDTTRMFTVLGSALAGAIVGLTMFFWALEHSSLLAFHAAARGEPMQVPLPVSALMFSGFIVANFALFFGLVQWSRYIRKHPRTYQLPTGALFSVVVVAGALLITALANHAAFVRSHDPIPMDVSSGYVAFQVVMGTMVLTSLVLLGVRWSPGYRPYVPPTD